MFSMSCVHRMDYEIARFGSHRLPSEIGKWVVTTGGWYQVNYELLSLRPPTKTRTTGYIEGTGTQSTTNNNGNKIMSIGGISVFL